MTRAPDGIENRATATRRYYHPLQKDYATFLKTSEETGGEYTLIEVEVAPGGGNAPHYHKTYDEHFEVLEGTLEVLVGEETRTLRPGQEAVAKKNTLHRFRNPTDEPTTFLVELRPGHGPRPFSCPFHRNAWKSSSRKSPYRTVNKAPDIATHACVAIM